MNDIIPKVYLRRPQRLYSLMRSFSRTLPIDIAKVRNILSIYDLDLIARPKPASDGMRSKSLIVNTTCGKKLIKRYKESLGQSTIIQEHSILKYLAQMNFPSPRLNHTKTGQTLIHYNHHCFAIFDYVESGFHTYDYVLFPKQTSKFLGLAGKTLGRLHATLSNFVPEGFNPDGFRSRTGDRWRNDDWIISKLNFCLEKTQNLKSKKRKAKVRTLLTRAMDFDNIIAHCNTIVRNANLPRQIIHKDYGPSNLLFLKSGPPIVLDFEIARLDWRIVDIITGWKGFCAKRAGYSIKKMRNFLDSYRTQMSLEENEFMSFATVWKLLLIRGSIRCWYQYCVTNNMTSLAQAYKKIAELDWVTANQERLRHL